MEQLNVADAFRNRSNRCGEVCIVLLSLLAVPVYLYGPGVLLLPVAGVLTALVLDAVVQILFQCRKRYVLDLHSVTMALIATLLLSPSTPVWVAIITVLFGLGVAKYPFGGTGHTLFNPAAVGLAFSLLCWPDAILKYPVPSSTLASTQSFYAPLSEVLRLGGTPKVDYFDLLLGQHAGPMGATAILILAACFLYLSFRRLVSPATVLSALVTAAVYAVLFPRLTTGALNSLVYELSADCLVYGCIFMAGGPDNEPQTRCGRVIYGILLGLCTMLFRQVADTSFTIVYALLLCSVTVPFCDRVVPGLRALFGRRKKVSHG